MTDELRGHFGALTDFIDVLIENNRLEPKLGVRLRDRVEAIRTILTQPAPTLIEHIKANPPDPSKPFHPFAWFNSDGNLIEFTWDTEESYVVSMKGADGHWIGSIMRGIKSGRVTGVKLHVEAAGIKIGFAALAQPAPEADAALADAVERWRNSGGFCESDAEQCFDDVYALAGAYIDSLDGK